MRSIWYNLNWLCLECLHASVYGSHTIKFAYIKRENICINVNSQFFCFFVWFVFFFPHLLNFPQNCFSQDLFCFSYFYRGRKLFLKLVAFHWGSCLYFLLSIILLCSLILYFLLPFVVYVFCLPSNWVVFVNMWQKGGEIDEIWESCWKGL